MIRPDGTLATLPRYGLLAVVIAGFWLATADPFTVLFYGSYVAVGALLVIRRPANRVSWLLIAIALGFLGTTSRPNVDLAALVAGHPTFGDALQAWIGGWIAPALFIAFGALTFVFPHGRLPTGRWGTASRVVFGAEALLVVLLMVEPVIQLTPNGGAAIDVPNPIGILPGAPIWPIVTGASYVVVLGGFGLAIASLRSRYRAADDQGRLQLRWLLAALTLVLVAAVAGLATLAIVGNDLGGLAWIPAIVAYPTVPIAVGVAVLRYRLYEIDRIVNRALVYGAVTAILAGVFAAATTLSQRVFVAMAGGSSDASAVLTTLVVVTFYAPVRRRVESIVDRYFKYDQRLYGAYLDDLRHLLDLLDPGRAAARLAREAMVHTGAVGVAVAGSDGSVIATAGSWPAEPSVAVSIDVAGSPLASVLVGPRRDGHPMTPASLAALREVAVVAASTLDPRRPIAAQRAEPVRAADAPEPAPVDVGEAGAPAPA